jgi:uncharacterized protein (DUF1501 family)
MKEDSTNKNMNKAHDEEHAQWDRRGFLKTLGVAGAGAISFGSSSLSVVDSELLTTALAEVDNDRVLVLIRLKGGNDGLNTIVPIYDFDTYANKRPKIHIPQNSLLKLNDDFGIPNYMKNLDGLWKNGAMKVVHGVGYENQNLSHFKSSEIWASNSEDSSVTSGWMGRYYEEKYMDYMINPPKKPLAIQIGNGGNLVFNGDLTSYAFSVSSPERLKKVAESGTIFDTSNPPASLHGNQVSFLREAANTTYRYASVIHEAYDNSKEYSGYEDNSIDLQLSLVSRFIKGGLGSKVYMVTLNGFDTHANQPTRHQTLMTRLSDSIKTFYTDLKNHGVDDKVLSMTFSEFGRRVAENGSSGTDHGSAAPIVLFGPALNGSSFVGDHPSLSTLDKQGNMANSTDFRSVYATLLTDWLCADSDLISKAMIGVEYNLLGLGLGCNGEQFLKLTNDPILPLHAAVYSGNDIDLFLNINKSSQVEIVVYDLLGRKVGTVFKNTLTSGKHNLPLRVDPYNKLPSGQYFYKIEVDASSTYSKAFLVK